MDSASVGHDRTASSMSARSVSPNCSRSSTMAPSSPTSKKPGAIDSQMPRPVQRFWSTMIFIPCSTPRPLCSVAGAGSVDCHWQVANAVDELAVEVLGLADLHPGQLGQDVAEQRAQLRLGDPVAQAVMHAAAAERDVRPPRAGQVEAVRVLEHALIPVAGAVEDRDLVPLGDPLAGQLGVLRRGPDELGYRAGMPDEPLDRGGYPALEVFR